MVLKHLVVKEIKQMLRNKVLPIAFIMLPTVMIDGVSYIATQEVNNLSVAVVDNDNSVLSHRLTEKINASLYFNVYDISPTQKEAFELMKYGDVDFIVTIGQHFEKYIYSDVEKPQVQIQANATNGMKGGLGNSYLMQIVNQFSDEIYEDTGGDARLPMSVVPSYPFNPTLDYKPYMIPSLIAMVLIILMGFLPALNVVGEKEKGTIEQINVSPIHKIEFILSKMIPYWAAGLFIIIYSVLLAGTTQGIWPAGSILLVILFGMIFVFTISALGLTVSNFSDNMRQSAMVMFFFVVMFILTSGLISPVACMPEWAQEATRINPLRYIIAALREIYLKGSSFSQLLPQFIPLVIYATLGWVAAIYSYKKNG